MLRIGSNKRLILENDTRIDNLHRILIVDKSLEDQIIIIELLEDLGVEIDRTTSGLQALRKIHLGYDLVITSLSTEDMDGMELLLRIKQVDVGVELIVTGHDRAEETVARVMRQGAFCYLAKPFTDKDSIVRAVRRALSRRHESRKEEALYQSIISGRTSIVDLDGGPYEIPLLKTGMPTVDLLSLMNDGFVFLDTDGRITFANFKFSRKLSCSYRSILNKLFIKYVFRKDREDFQAFLDRVRESRIGIFETRMVNRTGRVIHMMVTCRRLEMEDSSAQTLLVITDITDKRQAEERARMLAALVERAKFEAIFVYDDSRRIIHCNKAAQEMFGRSQIDTLTDTNLDMLFEHTDKEENAAPVIQEPKNAVYELSGIRAGGSIFPVEISESTDMWDEGRGVGLLFARDITTRKKAEAALLKTNKRLKAMNEELIFVREAQKKFFANMSHELKTPLNTIGGYASLMMEGVGGALSEKHLKWVESIKRQSNHLLLIIQEILEFAKLDKKGTSLSLKPVRPEPLIQEIAAAAGALLSKKPVQVETAAADEPTSIVTDPYRLRQILMNLTSNAVKFTPRGTITIGFHRVDAERAAFFVEDTGIGIAPEEKTKIFNDFYQIEQKETENTDGSGLGLAIVRRLAEQLGGTIDVDSEPNKGSKFIIILPIERARPAADSEPSGSISL